MIIQSWLILAGGGLISGILAGILGIGGGFIIVSLLVLLGYTPIQALATSSLVVLVSSSSGSFYNWRMGYLDPKRVLYFALPALVTAQIGVYLAIRIPPYLLLLTFGIFLLANIYLVQLRKQPTFEERNSGRQLLNPVLSKIGTGGIAGFLAGLLGIGGGMVMVPLQILLLGERIKVAIRTSLGVIVSAALSTCIVHASHGNVLFLQGLILGVGGLLGTQISSRILLKLPDCLLSKIFSLFLFSMSILMFWQAWKIYQAV